jgi:hypothetical protein
MGVERGGGTGRGGTGRGAGKCHLLVPLSKKDSKGHVKGQLWALAQTARAHGQGCSPKP